MTGSPTRIGSELASGENLAPGGTRSSWSSERSAAGSDETTLALTVSPPRNSTVISSMALTTWAAVMTLPSEEINTPEPVSAKRVWPPAATSRPLARITTTEGATLRKTSPGLWAWAPGASPASKPTVRIASSDVLISALLPESAHPPPEQGSSCHRPAPGPHSPGGDRDQQALLAARVGQAEQDHQEREHPLRRSRSSTQHRCPRSWPRPGTLGASTQRSETRFRSGD